MDPARFLGTTLCVLLASSSALSRSEQNSSGGVLLPEEAAYDVLHYDLRLTVRPAERTIDGRLELTASLVHPSERIVLDLDPALRVEDVSDERGALSWEREGDRIWIRSPRFEGAPGTELRLSITYGGTPRVAPNPPWEGGFTWAETRDGKPWIATSCQGEGADLWWPCKDHPSDEPDAMDLHITVPAPLVVASNGRLLSVREEDGWLTYDWRVSTPINNYGVALNIAPYETIETKYESTCGDAFDVTYWVLPENLEAGREFFPQIVQHLRFFEELFGPYPFRADKYGVAETPHLGMEHQSIIAYGNRYRDNGWGFDWLHHHELAHEWWANLVTARDWNDFWIHESFGTYAQALYVERLHGQDAYHEAMAENRRFANAKPVAPREPRTTTQMYFSADHRASDGDIYFKGAWVLHTLRWLIGDDAFFRSLRRMAYPDPELEKRVDGSACRFATTDDFLEIAEAESGMDLDWFFDVYLRQPELPVLEAEVRDGELHLSWDVPDDLPFPMPVPIVVDGRQVRVDVPPGGAVVALPVGAAPEIDPRVWILQRD